MKSAWHMEWDNEVRHIAPIRSYMVSFVLSMAEVRKSMVVISVSAEKALKQIRNIVRVLEDKD